MAYGNRAPLASCHVKYPRWEGLQRKDCFLFPFLIDKAADAQMDPGSTCNALQVHAFSP